MKKNIMLFAILLFSFLSPIRAQTTLNPDISLIGNICAFAHNDTGRPIESREFNLQSPDMELMVSGYLNPYSRADAVLAWEEGGNAEIEEFYATVLRGLPLGLNLRVGKYRLEFGRLNPVHPHAYSFIFQPLPHEEFFGEEGLNDMAIRTSFIIPTGSLYTEFMGAVLKGDILKSEDDSIEEEEDADSGKPRIKPGFFGRLTSSAAVSEYAELAAGASFATAEYNAEDRLHAWVYGIDMKYKWKPNRNISLTVEAEGLYNHREKSDGGQLISYGGYGYIDFHFCQKYNVGSIFEYTQGNLDKNRNSWRTGAFVGFSPIEETSLVRLVGNWTRPKETAGFWTLTAQLVFSLGPHQPHNF
jgi:hypothetical protein